MSKFCPNCGEQLIDNAVFCGRCGTRLEASGKDRGNVLDSAVGSLKKAGATLGSAADAAKNGINDAFSEENRKKFLNGTTNSLKKASEKMGSAAGAAAGGIAAVFSEEKKQNTTEMIDNNGASPSQTTAPSTAKPQEETGILLSIGNGISTFFEGMIDSFCPNFEKIFPTDESRYTNYMRLAYFLILMPCITIALKLYAFSASRRSLGTLTTMASTVDLLLILLVIFAAVVNIYIFVKSGTLRFVVKLGIGMILGILVSSLLGPFAVFLIPVAIIANRKRIAVLKQYISFFFYSLAMAVLPPLFILLAAYFMHKSIYGYSELTGTAAFMFFLAYISPVVILQLALRNEMDKGRSFYEIIRLMYCVPIVFILCCTSVLTLTHIGGLSDHSLFGDPGVDYLDMSTAYASPTDFGGLGVDSAPDTFGSVLDDFSSVQGPDLGAHDFGATPDIGHHDFGMTHDVGNSFSDSQAAPFTAHDASIQHSTGAEFTQFHHGDMGHTDVVSAHEMQNGHITLKDSMGHTVQTATTNNVTGKMTFHDTMGHQTGTATTDTVGGDTHFQNAMGQHQGTLTDQGNILNQLGMSEGNIKTTASGEVVIQDSLGHTKAIIKNGTILDAQNQTIGHIRK